MADDTTKQDGAPSQAAIDAAKTPGTTDVTPESASAGGDQVQQQVDEENAVGYRGTNPDPTPNHHYTVAGVTAGLPTPETSPDLAAQAHQTLRFGTPPDASTADSPKGAK